MQRTAPVDGDERAPGWVRAELAGGVLVRPPSLGDVPGIWAVHSDPAVYAFDPSETHPDAAYTRQWSAPIFEHWQRFGFGYWVVLVPAEWWSGGPTGLEPGDRGRVVAGMSGIRRHEMSQGELVLNVYYRFAPAVQGRGLARTLLDHALWASPLVLPGADLVVRTRPANAAARRVAERAGFTDLGIDPDEPGMQLLRRSAGPPGPVASTS